MVDELAAALRRGALAARYDALRRERAQPYEPWPFDGPRSTVARELLADALQAGGADAAPRARLAGLGVLDGDVPAVWSVTGHRGVLAAQDAAHVYIGSDSLRFADHVQNECATGTGLDVGCGSGISTCRLAATCTEVYAVDVVSEAVAATRVAAELTCR
jgi:methylase of polypeptide subunit release factors